MKKRLLVFAAIFAFPFFIHAQTHTQTLHYAGSGEEVFVKNLTDANGNRYLLGYHTLNMDGNPGSAVLSTGNSGGRDIFVTKLDSSGNFIWAQHIESTSGETPYDMAISGANLLFVGSFTGNIDLDPGTGVQLAINQGGSDAFAVMLDTAGNFQWSHNFGSTGQDEALSCSFNGIDAVIGGYFSNSIVFDPAVGSLTATSAGSFDGYMLFLSGTTGIPNIKYTFGSTGDERVRSIFADGTGNVFACGNYEGTVDFDPSGSTTNLNATGSSESFIIKTDDFGLFQWALSIGGMGQDFASKIVDFGGTLLVSGSYFGTIDVNPGAGISNLTGAGGTDVYLVKLDKISGTYLNSARLGGTSNEMVFDLAIDPLNNIFIAGTFDQLGTFDADPSAAAQNFTSAGGTDGFVVKLSNQFAYQWCYPIGSTGTQQVLSIADVSNMHDFYLYLCGSFANTVDFDNGSGTTGFTATGTTDGYHSVLSDCNTPTPFIAQTNYYICDGGTFILFDPSPQPLYSADEWVWYENSCGSTTTYAPGASISPNSTTSYFIRPEGGCVTAAPCQMITVNVNPNPSSSFTGLLTTFCANDQAVNLIPTGGGGTFAGDGVTGNQFDPSLSDTGVISVTYTVTDGMTGCSSSTTEFTTVFASPEPLFTMPDVICIDDLPVNLTGTPTGGTFTGTGVNGNTFDPSLSGLGTFALQYFVTNSNNCTASATDTVLVDACAGIAENQFSSAVIFPNPAHGIFQIHSECGKYTAVILNALGESVYKEDVPTNNTTINITKLPAGCYFVQIVSQGKIIQTEKLILE